MDDLYSRIEILCKSEGSNITRMCKEIGTSRGALSDLKAKRSKSLSSETLVAIANHFGITVDELLGKEKDPAVAGEVTKDSFNYALFEEIKDLTLE